MKQAVCVAVCLAACAHAPETPAPASAVAKPEVAEAVAPKPVVAEKGPEGTWSGSLDVGAIRLRLAIHVVHGDGGLTATLDSLDQNAKGIPFDKVSFAAPTLRVENTKANAVFEAALAGDTLTGTWHQNGSSFPLTLTRVDKIAELRRPQTPVPPFPYRQEDVEIAVQPSITLAGSLVVPAGAGPFPAVVFITGSGPEDRDETLFAHKPFFVIADALARRGIASLRLDDRGVGKSQGGHDATTLDLAADVEKEVSWLAARPEIDRRAIGVIGHSEGGIIGPIAATRSADIRFVVMLAGSGMAGDRVLIDQGAAIARAGGASADRVARDRADSEKLFAELRRSKTEAARKAAIDAFVAGDAASREGAGAMLSSAWMRAFLTLDPVPYLVKLRVPVLAISGDRDLQITPDNLTAIEAALKRGKNRDATVKKIEGVNHLFQHATTGLPKEYGEIEETIAPEVLQLVGDWIVARTDKLRAK